MIVYIKSHNYAFIYLGASVVYARMIRQRTTYIADLWRIRQLHTPISQLAYAILRRLAEPGVVCPWHTTMA